MVFSTKQVLAKLIVRLSKLFLNNVERAISFCNQSSL